MNVIDSNKLKHDVIRTEDPRQRKPFHTFRHHALIGAVIACVAFAIPPAAAQRLMPDNGNGRYSLVPKGDGFMRLDSRTGEISICAWRGAGWECVGIPDDRAAYDAEIGRLRDMVERLKRELAARDRVIAERAQPSKEQEAAAAHEAGRRAADAAEIARLKQESDRLKAELTARDRAIGEAKKAVEMAEKEALRPPVSLPPPPIAEKKPMQAEKERPSSEREPPAVKNLEPRLPDDAELDRAIAYLERAWRKLIDMVQRLQRESDRGI
jgi:uncharacterized protein YdcH (DUF465 family)